MPTPTLIDLHLTDGDDLSVVFEADHLHVTRVRIAPGTRFPAHRTNSNVLVVPLEGSLEAAVEGETYSYSVGQALHMPAGTEVALANPGDGHATVLVIRAPHPKAFA
jgi:quercetin dioxygenase-like cupin family protein